MKKHDKGVEQLREIVNHPHMISIGLSRYVDKVEECPDRKTEYFANWIQIKLLKYFQNILQLLESNPNLIEQVKYDIDTALFHLDRIKNPSENDLIAMVYNAAGFFTPEFMNVDFLTRKERQNEF